MAKNLKLKINRTELAKAAGLDKLKAKLSGEKAEEKKPKAKAPPTPASEDEKKKEGPRIRAKSKSSFAPQETGVVEQEKEEIKQEVAREEPVVEEALPEVPEEPAEEKLGPTGKHVKDLLAKKEPEQEPEQKKEEVEKKPEAPKEKEATAAASTEKEDKEKGHKGKKVREFKDLKPKKGMRPFDSRDRQGLSEDEEGRWRKKRPIKQVKEEKEELVVRPTELRVRLPISIKDLASAMKLKSGELIKQLFLQGMTYTVNDILDDETTVQYLGNEFNCHITIDTSEEERIQITTQSIREEISKTDPKLLKLRPPVVTFMGHVDHGKTSLIDAIRKSNRVAGEAGAITQHMGAFKCATPVGDLTILDTPGHEAFSAMRARGAEVTDIVILVVAGDEGIREQTIEAIQHAKAAKVTIVVAINKADKPNFNPENVYRQLAEVDLLPESWGGQTITVNTSAVTGEGISELLEMLALQAEVLELKANPQSRARGTVLESEMHKGLGMVARILVQNGTLNQGDAIVFERHWGKVKTMHDEHGQRLMHAGPSTPVEITGLSGLPAAGDPFIVVKSEKEARDIVEARQADTKQKALHQIKPSSLEKFLQKTAAGKKVLNLILRADVQGSVEALKTSIQKIQSEKVDVEVIFTGVGEISESDIQLAAASNAVIVGFHTSIEKHANELIRELGIKVILFDVIYHAIESIKNVMQGLLDKVEEQRDTGAAQVQAVFKSSQLGNIAGCIVTEGTIHRNNRIRVIRGDQVIWKGEIASLKRVKEDVKEVKKGFECGILLSGFNDVKVGDILQAYETIYLTQEI